MERTNVLLNLIKHQLNTDKTYSYAKNLCEPEYQLLLNKREQKGINRFKNLNAFLEYSNDIKDAYPNIVNYCPNTKRKISTEFSDMIVHMLRSKIT